MKNANLPVTERLLKPEINATLSDGTLTYPKKENKKSISSITAIGKIKAMFIIL